MFRFRALYSLTVLTLFAGRSVASIGPVADLVISNVNVAPDGFSRSSVIFLLISACPRC